MAQAHNVIKEARRVKGLKLNNGKIRGQDLLRYIDFGNWVNIVCEEYLVVFPPAPDACSIRVTTCDNCRCGCARSKALCRK